jgi:YidC/Oxa1 family membrane protein insertase
MDNHRLILFFAFALLSMLIWQEWEKEYRPPAVPAPISTAADSDTRVPGAPAVPGNATALSTERKSGELVRSERIEVNTDLVRADIDTQGGDLRGLWLLQHPVSVDQPDKPFALLQDVDETELYIVQSGLVGHGDGYPTHKVKYATAATRYVLGVGQDTLRVPLTYRGPDGTRYTKTYIFTRGSYVVDVAFEVANQTKNDWTGFFYGQFVRAHVEQGGIFSLPTYTGAAIYTPEQKYEKIALADMTSKPLRRDSQNGWVAMLQHYFVGAWLPSKDDRHQIYSDVLPNQRAVIGLKSLTPLQVAAGQTGVTQTRLYLGPKEQERLAALAPGLELTVDYGWLTVISAPLFWLLDWIYGWIGNWGWAICILTLLIKLAFYPLSAASYRSMAHMKNVQPKLQALKERYGDDRQKLNQAMMELYKTEKINPLGGCLPIVIQIPVFLALYWVLLESVELRHAPWVLWIRDLSSPDKYFVLPIIMGVTMYLQQLLNPQPPDPIQRRIFMIMPVVFTAMFLFFPSGLVLYWTVNNVLSILQQWYITRTINAKPA